MTAIIKKEIGKPTAENPAATPSSVEIKTITQTVKKSILEVFDKLATFFALIKKSILSLLGRISTLFKQAEPTTQPSPSPLSPQSIASAIKSSFSTTKVINFLAISALILITLI